MLLVQFAVQTEVCLAVYSDWQSQVRTKEAGQLPLQNTGEDEGQDEGKEEIYNIFNSDFHICRQCIQQFN